MKQFETIGVVPVFIASIVLLGIVTFCFGKGMSKLQSLIVIWIQITFVLLVDIIFLFCMYTCVYDTNGIIPWIVSGAIGTGYATTVQGVAQFLNVVANIATGAAESLRSEL